MLRYLMETLLCSFKGIFYILNELSDKIQVSICKELQLKTNETGFTNLGRTVLFITGRHSLNRYIYCPSVVTYCQGSGEC